LTIPAAVIVYTLPLLTFGLVARYYPALVGALVFGGLFLPRQRLELNEREAIIRSGKTPSVPLVLRVPTRSPRSCSGGSSIAARPGPLDLIDPFAR
jgi:hypothetical protein